MIYSSIKPTFSIPSAAKYFKINVNNTGFVNAENKNIDIDYLDYEHMKTYSLEETNPLELQFKKEDINDENDYRITKILANKSSIINENNPGKNVKRKEYDDNSEIPGYCTIYENAEEGGINFTNFQMDKNNYDIQLVFYVYAKNGMSITVECKSVEFDNGVKFTLYFISPYDIAGLESFTKKITEQSVGFQFGTAVSYSGSEDGWQVEDVKFEYGLIKNDIFPNITHSGNTTQTGEIVWTVTTEDVQNIIWTNDPVITVSFFSIEATISKITGEFAIPGSGRYIYELITDDQGNERWEPTSDSVAGNQPIQIFGDIGTNRLVAINEESTLAIQLDNDDKRYTETDTQEIKYNYI